MTHVAQAAQRPAAVGFPYFSSFSDSASRVGRGMVIVAKEAWATVTYVIPSMLRWHVRVQVLHSIREEKIKNLFKNSHGTAGKPPLLFLHGDFGHPYTMLPLMDACSDYPVYSMKLSYNEKTPQNHRLLLEEAIDLIKESHNSKVILVGHSKGAIEGAHQAFVEKNPNVRSVVSIAGRLALVPNDDSCHPDLQPTIREIQEGIKRNDRMLVYQIVAEHDWQIPIQAASVREGTTWTIHNALHLNVLFYKKTISALRHFLDN